MVDAILSMWSIVSSVVMLSLVLLAAARDSAVELVVAGAQAQGVLLGTY